MMSNKKVEELLHFHPAFNNQCLAVIATQSIMSFVQIDGVIDERSPIDPTLVVTTTATTTSTTTCTTEISSCPYALRKLQQQQRRHFGYSTFRINNNNTNGCYNGEAFLARDSKQQQQRNVNDNTAVWPYWLSSHFVPSSSSSARQYYYQQESSSSSSPIKESSSSSPRINCCNYNFSNNKRHYESDVRCHFQSLILRIVLKWPWKLVFSMLVCIALSMFHFRRVQEQQKHSNHFYHFPYYETSNTDNNDDAILSNAEPEWSWDHNIYNPQQRQGVATATAAGMPMVLGGGSERNLLLAQMAGSEALQTMAEISSRPNRAYARQWGRDYVLYKGSAQTLERACFDKVVVLSTILDRQLSLLHASADFWSLAGSKSSSEQQQQQPATAAARSVQYDVVALFPPDATMTNLDSDLLNLMPPDKLLAIARWQLPESSTSRAVSASTMTQALSSGIVLFNLRHKYASTVVKLWYSMVEPPVSCGACNDLLILLHAVQTVLEQEQQESASNNNHNDDDDDHTNNNNNDDDTSGVMSENIMNAISSVVASLDETNDGFVGGYSIKTIPITVPAPKAAMLVANKAQSRAELQKTADSVCYRYYPKCEVL